MKKHNLALITVLLLSTPAFAGEFIPAAGFGPQYGDLGAKVSYRENNLAFFAGVGIHGAALGAQMAPASGSPHAFGVMYGTESDIFNAEELVLVTYDYHLTSFSGRGWVLGAGLGQADRTDRGRDGDSKTIAVLNIGYKF